MTDKNRWKQNERWTTCFKELGDLYVLSIRHAVIQLKIKCKIDNQRIITFYTLKHKNIDVVNPIFFVFKILKLIYIFQYMYL